MGGKGGGGGGAPTPTIDAQAQTAANMLAGEATTKQQLPTEISPTGSVTWSQSSTDPLKWTETTALNEPQQSTLEAAQGAQKTFATGADPALASQAATAYSTPFTYGGPAIPGTSDAALTTGMNQAEQGVMGQFHALNDPSMALQRQNLDTQLKNQGIETGTTADVNAKTQLGAEQNQLIAANNNAAINAGLAEQQALFGEKLGANQQGFGQAVTQYGIPMATLNAALGNSAVSTPAFQQPATGAIQAAPIMQGQAIDFNQLMQAASANNVENANKQNLYGGLGRSAINTGLAAYDYGQTSNYGQTPGIQPSR